MTQKRDPATRGQCILCGHQDCQPWAIAGGPFIGHEYVEVYLCHTDDHSCYVEWTVEGKRPEGEFRSAT